MDAHQTLSDAIREDDHFLIQSALRGINIADYREDDGGNLLHLSVDLGNACLAKYFIQAGCDINGRDKEGNVPLWCAISLECECERLPLVKLLVEAGARLDIKNSDNDYALNACINDDPDDEYDDLECAQILLDGGADVNVKGKLGETSLYKAAFNLSDDSVDLLLNHGADPNVENNDRETALHAATSPGASVSNSCHQRQLKILQSLLNHGAAVNVRNNKGQTPLHYILHRGDKESIQLLLEHGADLRTKDRKGRSPMHYAAGNTNVDGLRFLLDNGFGINECDNFGRTALYEAVKCEAHESIRILHKNGANMNATDKNGMTPLHKLIDSYKTYDFDFISNDVDVESLVDLLIDLGANVNALTQRNRTLFDLAKKAVHCSSQYFVTKLLAKLEFLGKEIDVLLKKSMKSQKKYLDYHKKCLSELSVIKDYIFYDAARILPVFMNDRKVITRYVKRQDLVEAFNAINFDEIFPVYGKGIKHKFTVVRSRHELRIEASQLLSQIIPQEIRNPLIIQNIIEYINDSDLVYLTNECLRKIKYFVHDSSNNVHMYI